MDEKEICGRCLIHISTQSYMRVVLQNGSSFTAPDITNPTKLKEWIEEQWYGNSARLFESDSCTNVVKAISTWHGDPVCAVHLWLLREQEMRISKRS